MNEGNVLLNDALDTFLFMVMSCQIYGKEPDSERGNPLLPHSLLFLISSKCSIYSQQTDRIAYTTAFVTPVVEHWMQREIT